MQPQSSQSAITDKGNCNTLFFDPPACFVVGGFALSFLSSFFWRSAPATAVPANHWCHHWHWVAAAANEYIRHDLHVLGSDGSITFSCVKLLPPMASTESLYASALLLPMARIFRFRITVSEICSAFAFANNSIFPILLFASNLVFLLHR